MNIPAVTYEERRLPPLDSPDPYPRWYVEDRKRAYRAAVVPQLAGAVLDLAPRSLAEADDASAAIVRFDAEYGQFPAPFAAVLLRSESASSSQIEHLPAGARAIAEAVIGERAEGNGPQIASNVRAMQVAGAMTERLDDSGIIAMHRALLAPHAPGLTGGYRTQQVWIGGRLPHEAAFVPPHHERVPEAMADFVAFAARTDLPVLAHAAIAHALFETIHPFPDGNGRTGRAIVQSMLRRGGLIRHVTIPVSSGLLADLPHYHRALEAFREGDADAIVVTFAAAAMAGLDNARQLGDELRALRLTWAGRFEGLRVDAAARRLADVTIGQPVVNLRYAMEALAVSQPTAGHALDELVERRILTPGNSKRRNRLWVNQAVVDALDAFAARSALGPAR